MAKKNQADYVMRYIGGGDFVDGVPARDMTREEWETVEQARRELALKLNLYTQMASDAPKEGE